MTDPTFSEQSDKFEVYSSIVTLILPEGTSKPSFFSPIAGLSFYFKYGCDIEMDMYSSKTFLKLKLVKLKESRVSKTLRMSIDISISEKGVTFVQECEKYRYVNVYEMNEINYQNIFIQKFSTVLTIKYCLKFADFAPLDMIPSQSKALLQGKNSFKHFFRDFKLAYEQGVFSDVQFIIDENILPAHKFILAAHSPVFTRMLTSDFQESRTNAITITDSSYEVFNGFLKYLYSGEIENRSCSNVCELYGLADKYEVAVLQDECREIIPSLLNVDTVCDILVLVDTYKDYDMNNIVLKYASDNINNIMESDQYRALAKSHPQITNVLTYFWSLA